MIKRLKGYTQKYIQYIILIISIFIGSFIRLQSIANLKSSILNTYLPQALDPFYFLRIAQLIASPTGLPSIDIMRSAPIGQPLTFLNSLMSYFLVLFNKFLNLFGNFSLEYSTILFPVAIMGVTSIILFLLIKKLLGWETASLGVLIFNIIPSLIHRTNVGFSDHDILGMMFMLLTFYLLIVAQQKKEIKQSIIFGMLSSVSLTIGLLVAGNVKLAIIIISISYLLMFILGQTNKKEYYIYLSWLLPITIIGILTGNSKLTISTLAMSSSGIIAYFTLISMSLWFILQYKKWDVKLKIPRQIQSLIGGIILSLIGGIALVGASTFFNKISLTIKGVFNTFSATRHATTVAENRVLEFSTLISSFGWLFFIFFLIGSWILFYKLTEKLKERKKLSTSFGTYLLLFLISKSINSEILFIISTILFILTIMWFSFKEFKEKEINKIKFEYVFLLVWMLTTTYIVNLASRLMFEFTPIVVIFGTYFIIILIKKILLSKKILSLKLTKKIKITLIIAMILILFAPLGFYTGTLTDYYQTSKTQAKYISPGLNTQWQYASAWARENTPEDAIFAHWWDYGYWIQYGFQRSTITDGGNQINLWNHYMGRHVLTGTTLEEPLKFLKAHNATHLLMVSDEISKYGAYSLIGSDEKNDRESYISTFGLNTQYSQETRNNSILVYTGNYPLDENLIYDGKIYLKKESSIVGLKIPIKKANDSQIYISNIEQPIVYLTKGDQPIELRLQCLYVQGQEIKYNEYDLEGCFQILPLWISSQKNNQLGAGLFLSKKTYNSVLARLYLLNQQTPLYKLVYNDEQGAPLSIYQGRLIGPIKIWEIDYPTDLIPSKEEKEHYLATSFEEVGLEKAQ